MRLPTFLSVEDVLLIHAGTIAEEGGLAGVRNYGLLESAVLMPQQRFAGRYLHRDLPAMAAAYLYHICRNHPFLDGNKRAAAMAAYVFLDVNGLDLSAAPADLESTVLAVAAGDCSKLDLTRWMRRHCRRRES